MKPVIGLTSMIKHFSLFEEMQEFNLAATRFVKPIVASGGVPVLLSHHANDLDSYISLIDGLILNEGADVTPQMYGHTRHEKSGPCYAERDAFEIQLVKKALIKNMPILGICRGMQILNVALGGTLIQDIPDEASSVEDHNQRIQDKLPIHQVKVQRDSLTFSIFE